MTSDHQRLHGLQNAIAIVGMAGRFPGADTPEAMWRNAVSGVCSVTRFETSALEDAFDDATRAAPNFVAARPILQGVEDFDAGFFGMLAREAELTDPQQRVFLEIAWEALEDAGYDPLACPGSVGVFAGASINTYFLHHVCADRRTLETFTSDYQVGSYPMLLGAGADFLSTRVSYKLDLRGPSVTLSSACSTSLVAVADACQSLLLFQCDMALAGGVSISLPQKRGYLHQEGGMVSADGTCRTFDAAATGTVFGSGAGVVLLKRYEDALADGDHVYAVIRGWGVNNDGAQKVGFTAPSADGQADAIVRAHEMAEIEPRSVGYVECHGTATPLGDPIEVAGLTRAFARGTAERGFCALGSAKPNVGHLDAAAGVTGLIRAALALRHRTLPPMAHFRTPNPLIDFAATPFHVPTQATAWPRDVTPRRAGVSAFGVGGTNAHMVLEEAPSLDDDAVPLSSSAGPQVVVVSARSAAALTRARENLAARLTDAPGDLRDIAWTLQTGRRCFAHRHAVVASTCGEAAEALRSGRGAHAVAPAATRDVAFLFPGQGAQYPRMAHDLYRAEPVFREAMHRCAAILRAQSGLDLIAALYGSARDAEAAQALRDTRVAQPAIFAVSFALSELWASWGIRPTAMVGHSVGEFVAAVLAGVMTLEDALAIVAERGRLMADLPGGGMLSVRMAADAVRAMLPDTLDIAAENAPALCVVAGPHEALAAFERTLVAREVACRMLHTSHAFHSRAIEPVVTLLAARIAAVALHPPATPFVSCVTGTWITDAEATSPAYWAAHARAPVRFAAAIATLAGEAEPPLLLEVGPGAALVTLARQCLRPRDIAAAATLPDAARDGGDAAFARQALATVWTQGASPDWAGTHDGPRRRVSLPTYPFERSRHWIEPPARAVPPHAAPAAPSAASVTETIVEEQTLSAAPTACADMHAAAIRQRLVTMLDELSGGDTGGFPPEASFVEMGFDSLFLSQVVQRIQSQFKVKLAFRQLLRDLDTLDALTAHLAPLVAQAPAASVPAPAVARPAASPVAGSNALEQLMREQMQAMAALFARQLEAVGGLSGGAPTVPAPVLTAPVVTASIVARAVAVTPSDDTPSRFTLYKPGRAATGGGLTPVQRRYVDALIERTTRKTPGSKQRTQAHRRVLADPRVASGFRAEWKEMVYPIIAAESNGARFWDIDGNEYIDVVNGYGQTAFGHAAGFVVDAMHAQLDRGYAMGPQAELAGEVAALFCEITGNERMTFCNTGSEAVMAAMRIARTVTGRDTVVMFSGAYHGQFDEVLVKPVRSNTDTPRSMPVAPGIPAASVSNVVVLDYATPEALAWVEAHADDLAAVIVEPVQSRHPGLQPFEFLRAIRAITEKSGTAFVLDEVVTGFRVHPGGMQAVVGIRADMATYGKVVGGGMPIGLLAGRAAFMDALDGGDWRFGDDSAPEVGVTFFAGTFVRHPVTLAATLAVLRHIQAAGPALQATIAARTTRLRDALNALFARFGATCRAESYTSFLYFAFGADQPLGTLLFYELRERGIYAQDGFPIFLTTAHGDAEVDAVIAAFSASLAALAAIGAFGPVAVARDDVTPTESQTEIWLTAQLGDAASCAFNESVTVRLDGPLDAQALRRALDALVARHDALRASFAPTGETMRVAVPRPVALACVDVDDRAFDALLDRDARTPFDLVEGPLLRATLARFSDSRHALVLTAHHIVCDGWSFNVMVGELALLYAGETAGLGEATAFSAYADRMAARPAGAGDATAQFWREQFATPVAVLELPLDRPRAGVKTFEGATRTRIVGPGLATEVRQAGARRGATLFATLLAAFEILMGRLGGQREVVVGVPTAGQALLDGEVLVGHCVNFLPIRLGWQTGETASEHLRSVSRRFVDAQEHGETTLGTIARDLDLPREAGRIPLTEIQFNLERLADGVTIPGLAVAVEPNAKAFVNFDIFLNVVEGVHGLRLDCDFNTALFDATTIDRWLASYETVLAAFVADLDRPVAALSIIPACERAWLVDTVNATTAPYPRDRGVHALIADLAARRPDATAITAGAVSLSYRDLDRQANQLAHHLRASGAPAGGLVGVLVGRSPAMVVALLAVLKAGCAYVPLDPRHPPARLRAILDEARVAVVIGDDDAALDYAPADTKRVHIGRDAAEIDREPTHAPEITTEANTLAYVIYTSGSTGRPKGVEVDHAALVNLLTAVAVRPGFTERDTLLAVTTVAFDIAALELFLPLMTGGTVAVASEDQVSDGAALAEAIVSTGATMLQATPSSWELLLEAGFSARPGFRMLCGGEALSPGLAARLLNGQGVLWNMYGPTETTVWSSCAHVAAADAPITIGTPLANTRMYILDKDDQLVPTGALGQLHIAGAGVARGYLQRPELTAEKFVVDPFGPGRIYRTGDLARRLPNGDILVLGRLDHQVKLRGYRIELGEIEAVLMRRAGLAGVVVTLSHARAGTPELVAYVVPGEGTRTPLAMREALSAELPDYMIPTAWVMLDRLPTLPNGKLDRAALPAPGAAPTDRPVQGSEAPITAAETRVATIVGEVLGTAPVGRDADILALGLDSIQLFQVSARAHRAGLRLTVKTLMRRRTVAAIAADIEAAQLQPALS